MTAQGRTKMSVEEFVRQRFGGHYVFGHVGRDIAVLVGMIVLFNTVRVLALRLVRMVRR